MKKIPTLFVRFFDDNHNKTITTEITKGLEWVLAGEGFATLKIDGSCCCFLEGKFYRRYDAKNGKTPPNGAIACCDPDPITGHWPHWIEVDVKDPSSKWYLEAYNNTDKNTIKDGTYEAIGPHFKDNPYNLEKDILVKHGEIVLDVPRSFEGIKDFLEKNIIEGIVFWKDGVPKCKIKRSDFGFKWPEKKKNCMNRVSQSLI